jgi:hypothetical protein
MNGSSGNSRLLVRPVGVGGAPKPVLLQAPITRDRKMGRIAHRMALSRSRKFRQGASLGIKTARSMPLIELFMKLTTKNCLHNRLAFPIGHVPWSDPPRLATQALFWPWASCKLRCLALVQPARIRVESGSKTARQFSFAIYPYSSLVTLDDELNEDSWL